MTYAASIDVHAPAAVYQVLHAQLLETTGGQVDGLLVHLARPTADGFQVLEVWDTKASVTSGGPADLSGPPWAGGEAARADSTGGWSAAADAPNGTS